MSEWQDKVREYRAAGFSYDEIAAETARRRMEYAANGFTEQEINDYFTGGPEVDDVNAAPDVLARTLVAPPVEGEAPAAKPARSLAQSFEAGFDVSALGLIGGRPDRSLPENSGVVSRIAYVAGITVGDLLPAVAGGAGGVVAGVQAGPVGAAAAGGAGAAALPEAIRSSYLQYYEKGKVTSPREFLDRVIETTIATGKAAVIGAVSGGAGAKVRAATAGAGASVALQNTAQLGAEAGAMLAASSAVEGRLPTRNDIIDAGAMLVLQKAGLKAGDYALRLQKKAEVNLMRHWKETGEHPRDAARRAEADASFRESLLLDDPTLGQDTVTLRDGDGGEITVVRSRKQPDQTKGKETPVDPTGETSPEDTVNLAFRRRDDKAETVDDLKQRIYKEHFDEAHPFNQMLDAIAEGSDKPLDVDGVKRLMEDTYYTGPRAEFVMRKGFEEKGVPGLDDIIPKEGKRRKEFDALVRSLHAEELHQKEIVNPVDRASAQEVIRSLGKDKDLLTRAKQLTDFNNAALDVLVEGGVVSAETAAAWKAEYKYYVPFRRVMDEAPPPGIGGAGKRAFNPKKEQKGSERLIVDPIDSTVAAAYSAFEAADRNRAALALLRLAQDNPEATAGFIKEKPAARVKVEVTAEERQRFGVAAETMALWRSARSNLGKNDIAVFDNGKMRVVEVAPDVARYMSGLDQHDLGVIGKIMAGPNRVLKAGITLSPDFPIVQVLRDNPWQFIFDTNEPAPYYSLIKGVMHMAADTPEFRQWQKEGGALTAIRAIGDDYRYGEFHKRYDPASADSSWGTVRNVIRSPLHMAKIWADFWANAPRVGTFVRELEAGRATTAISASRRGQINFLRQGAVGRLLNRVIPFYNPTMQALDTMARSVAANPQQVLLRASAVVTAPALTAWALYRDEDWYKELPQWQKDQALPLRIGDTTYLIPFPPGVGVLFGGLPRRMLEKYIDDNPAAADGIVESLIGGFTPAISVAAFTPIVEQMANYSFFKKRPLVPDSVKDALPEDQYTQYTSDTAVLLSRALADFPLLKAQVSPIVIENYVRGWTGSAGSTALKLADDLLRAAGVSRKFGVAPAKTLDDIPFLSRFAARDPSSAASSINTYYENLRKHEAVMRSISLTEDRLVLEPGAPDRLKALYRENTRELMFLAGARETLSALRKYGEMIDANPDMTADEKRRLLDNTTRNMIMVARQANTVYARLGDKLEETKK